MMLVPLVAADQIAFWIFGPIAVLCAIGMVLSRKPVHAAVSLAGTMVSLAALYAAQDAPLLFVLQIIVYTGAVLMLFLFVVMLVGISTQDSVVETLKGQRVATILAALAFLVMLIAITGRAYFGTPIGLEAANAQYGGNVEGIAALLFSRYVFVFEATSALLITAAVGAIVMAHGERLVKKKTQIETAEDKLSAYASDGAHFGPGPNPGIFARHNAIYIPALLPDGSVAESSLSQTLLTRGAVVEVDELRQPGQQAFKAIEKVKTDAKGETE